MERLAPTSERRVVTTRFALVVAVVAVVVAVVVANVVIIRFSSCKPLDCAVRWFRWSTPPRSDHTNASKRYDKIWGGLCGARCCAFEVLDR